MELGRNQLVEELGGYAPYFNRIFACEIYYYGIYFYEINFYSSILLQTVCTSPQQILFETL
jgi:hypothetical protein